MRRTALCLRVQLMQALIIASKCNVATRSDISAKLNTCSCQFAIETNHKIWNGIDENTSGEAKKGLYFYEITPIEYGDTRARTLVGVLFLDR